jgi:hypothetical protein
MQVHCSMKGMTAPRVPGIILIVRGLTRVFQLLATARRKKTASGHNPG